MSDTSTRFFTAKKANGNPVTVWVVNVYSELPVTDVAEGDVGFVLDTCVFYERLVNTSGWTLVFDAGVFEGTIDAGDIVGLQTAVEGFLADELAGKANTSHTHAQSDITNLVSDLAGKAASVHTHTLADITDEGTIASQNANNVSISGGSITGITDLAIADGGTGQSTATAAFDALAPTTTAGDTMYHNGTDNVRLAAGTSKQFLKQNAGATAPEWVTQPFPIGLFTNVQTITNIPAATTEFPAAPRLRTDLSFWDEIQYMASVFIAGNAGSNMFLQYSTDGAAWSTLTTNTISLAATGAPTRTAFEDLPSGAKADVYVRVVTNGGDAAADPIVGYIYMILR